MSARSRSVFNLGNGQALNKLDRGPITRNSANNITFNRKKDTHCYQGTDFNSVKAKLFSQNDEIDVLKASTTKREKTPHATLGAGQRSFNYIDQLKHTMDQLHSVEQFVKEKPMGQSHSGNFTGEFLVDHYYNKGARGPGGVVSPTAANNA